MPSESRGVVESVAGIGQAGLVGLVVMKRGLWRRERIVCRRGKGLVLCWWGEK